MVVVFSQALKDFHTTYIRQLQVKQNQIKIFSRFQYVQGGLPGFGFLQCYPEGYEDIAQVFPDGRRIVNAQDSFAFKAPTRHLEKLLLNRAGEPA